MFHTNLSRLLLIAVIAAFVVTTVGTTPAAASSKTGHFIAGLAIGAIIGAALSDDDNHCDRPRYDPPCYGGYGYGSPRQSYDNGYRDGYSDGTHNGRRQGYDTGYRYGYDNGRRDQWQADNNYSYGPYSNYRPPCR
ncbi:MAG: hypothetical protein ABFD94_14150 [Armatimonadia bacterium]